MSKLTWELRTYNWDTPELESSAGDMVEIWDDGALRVDIDTEAGTYTVVVPAEDMATLRAAWDERQEQLGREKAGRAHQQLVDDIAARPSAPRPVTERQKAKADTKGDA